MCYDTIFFHSYKSIVTWYVRRLSRESVVGSAAERTHNTHLAAHLRPLALGLERLVIHGFYPSNPSARSPSFKASIASSFSDAVRRSAPP